MSDNSSTGSSTNSWTLLSPEEAAVENVGPVDDGTESLGDVPSLSEDVTGAAASDIPVETVLSEEGHQVCQETSPDSGEGPIPSSPTRMSPLPSDLIDRLDLDLESQPPVIHDIVTSSPSDNEHLGATPFVTNMDSGPLLDMAAADFLTAEPEERCSAPPPAETHAAAERVPDASADFGPSSAFAAEPEVDVDIETLTATAPPSCVDAVDDESAEPPSQVPESLGTESPINDSPAPETVGPVEAEEKEEEEVEEEAVEEVAAAVEKEEMELPETVTQYEREQEEGEEDDEEEGGGMGCTYRNMYDDLCMRNQAVKLEISERESVSIQYQLTEIPQMKQ
ncbi:hypothetical protein EYF80_020859 [Liparis tanakae]|uniref:Uncharacterized protein n=1 Tax=Liparis tanakae TaxID=230148 RepID=A0A4Z2HTB8_9TELE|nr:hypothetical protein EYF80_020859 [Liparis tanakae]